MNGIIINDDIYLLVPSIGIDDCSQCDLRKICDAKNEQMCLYFDTSAIGVCFKKIDKLIEVNPKKIKK